MIVLCQLLDSHYNAQDECSIVSWIMLIVEFLKNFKSWFLNIVLQSDSWKCWNLHQIGWIYNLNNISFFSVNIASQNSANSFCETQYIWGAGQTSISSLLPLSSVFSVFLLSHEDTLVTLVRVHCNMRLSPSLATSIFVLQHC